MGNLKVTIIVRKGDSVATFAAMNTKVASQVGRGWADRGYFVTVVCHPATVTN